MCSPFTGLGKPEPFKWELQGAWSRRIDSANRLVYMVDGGDLVHPARARPLLSIGVVDVFLEIIALKRTKCAIAVITPGRRAVS